MASMKSLSILVILTFLLVAPLTAAMNIDNKKSSIDTDGLSFRVGEKELEYNTIWDEYKPLEVKNLFGFGKTLLRGAITSHTDVCGDNCSSTMQIYLAEDSVLIDDVTFYTLQSNESWVEQDVRSYQFYINGNSYTLGTEMPAGTYEIRLDGEKKPSRTVDWVVETQGEELREWAVWGNISSGDDAQVTLNSPADNYISLTNEVTFDATAEVTGGAGIVNMSLWTNESGSWEVTDTDSFSGTLYNPNSNTDTSNTFDKDYDTYASKSFGSSGYTDSHNNELGKTFDSRKIGTVNYKSQFNYGLSPDWTSIVITLQSYDGTAWNIEATNSNSAGTISTLLVNRSVVLNKYVEGLKIRTVVSYSGDNSFTGFTSTFKTYELDYNILEVNYTHSETISNNTTLWNVQACDSDGDCGFAPSNYTLLLDTVPPTINITYPVGTIDYAYLGQNISFNWTVSDINLEQCWYNYNNTNTSVTCTDQNTSFILTNQKNITFYVNDSVANKANFTRSWDYKIFSNSETCNLTTYETAREGFKLNLTSDGTKTVLASLVYDGTAYASTKVGNNSEMEFNKNFIMSEVDIATAQNRSFYWNVTYGSEVIPTKTKNQSVSRIALGLCNATLIYPYITFIFEDEETTLATNASIDTSTWTYYLGDGTVNKTLRYSTTSSAESYGFCFTPSDRIITNSLELQYSDTGYPQRRWSTSGSLTNTTSTPTLYMLSSADGTYSVYQVQNTVGSGIEGVEVIAERQFAGEWALVEQGVTDSSGGFTGWLDPDYDHRMTFTKEGYTTQQVTVRPSSSTYTVVMSSGEAEATYNSSREGLSWTVYPDLGKVLFPNTTQMFLFNITANLSNIVSCKMEVINNNSVSMGTTIGCDSKGGNLSLSIPLGKNRSTRAIYSVDIGEGYFILDADAYWGIIDMNIPERGTLVAFFKHARELNQFGNDDNRQEYSRIVFFFLMLSIIMGYISYNTGWDFSTAGGSMCFMTFLIIFASYGGFLTISYTGANNWLDQYVVALITSLITGGYILNGFAREA